MTPAHERAFALLSGTGILRSSYAPPLSRLLWRLGLDIPPPHFAPFALNAAIFGLAFAIIWAVIFWLLSLAQVATVDSLFLRSAIAGLLFGVGLSAQIAYSRHKHNLPTWAELQARRPGGA